VKKALRTYTRDFIAILLLGAIGILALFVILSQQASALPSWFPFLGEDRFELKTELQTAQAVTPGQGQTVDISGVKVGDVTSVNLVDGVAVVTMQVDNEYSGLIHEDASVLLRPRTGLQDMVIELDPGTDSSPTVPEGFTVPLANSAPNVNFDQILASLDGDTQAYLRLLLAGGAQALGTKAKSERFASVLRRFEPTTRDLAKINGALAERRDNLRHVITNFKLIAEEIGKNDTNLSGFVSSQNQVFGAFADQEQALRATFRGLPGALRETRGALGASATLSRALKPALTDLLPQAQALGPALRATRPFFRRTLPAVRDQLRPFTGEVAKTVSDLKKGAEPLKQSTSALTGGLTELNNVLNALAYNPSGSSEGYLFYATWLNHNTNAAFLTQDGLGPLRRSLLMYSCFTSQLADNLVATRPALATARDLIRLPTTEQICPPTPFRAPGPDGGASSGTPDATPGGDQSTTTTPDTSTTAPSTSTTTPSTTTTAPPATGATTPTLPAPPSGDTSTTTTIP
jgi:phospholipid/cholesterol/gamma-HCH transport system substrate-binding protein